MNTAQGEFSRAAPRGKLYPLLRRYGGAVLGVAAALGLRYVLHAEMAEAGFAIPLAAMVIIAWLGGIGPCLLGQVLILLGTMAWFPKPSGSSEGTLAGAAAGLAAFFLIGIVVALLGDATRSARRKLRAERERLRATLASIGDGVIATDAQGAVTFMNDVAGTLTGWKTNEAKGRPLTEVFRIINEQTRAAAENPCERVLRTGKVLGLANHTVLIARDGTERPIDDSAAPIRDDDGRTCGVVLVFRDTTDAKKTQEALRQSEIRLRLAQAAARMGSWDYDLVTHQAQWSPEMFELYGLDPELGAPPLERFADLVHPDDQEATESGIAAAAACGGPFAIEFRVVKPGGDIVWITSSGVVDVGKDGRSATARGIDQDVTARKEAELALKDADRRKDEFLAILAHELRNPLAPIRTGLELMRMAPDDAAILEETREMMERQTQQLVTLVDDLLDVSRITRGRLELRKCRINIADVVQSALEASHTCIDESKHELAVELPERPILIDADPHRLAQVISNLLNNAAKYTPERGRIELIVQQQGSDVVVSIKDTGIGIPHDMLNRIFDMFSQIDRPMEKGYTGLGVGLTLVKSLVEMHGGSIEVHSKGANRGSEFRVRLPIMIDLSASEPRLGRFETSDEAAGLRILVVDDSHAAADLLSRVVKLLGNDVRTAYDGQQAVEVAAEFLPDVVVMDLGMPKMNGYEAAQQIRQQAWGEAMMLVALTGWGQEEDKLRTRQAGFDHHLVKPPEPAELQRLFRERARCATPSML